jgi:capsular polysaccharide transport system permease protein
MNEAQNPTLLRSLSIQVRVVHALIMREIITRYGRHNIGFAWLFLEPMMFTGGIMVLWSTMNLHNTNGASHLNIVALALTGYSTILVWRNGIGRCTLAILPNLSLLFHRNVRVIDLFIARLVLEIGGATFSAVTLMAVMTIFGVIAPPQDVLTMIYGWVLLCWYTIAMGMLIGALTEYSDVIERLWHPVSYFQLPVSGALIMTSTLPPSLRHIVLLFPTSSCAELFRYGYFGKEVTPYYDIPYVIISCLILTWLGLYLVQGAAKRVESE